MGHVYSAIEGDSYGLDTTAVTPWPPWPMPEPPWPSPPPFPPHYPPYDPDDPVDPEDNPYGVNTWRFRHIARSINERRSLFGLLASGLPTATPDLDITYTNINSAREALEDMISPVADPYFIADLITGQASKNTVTEFLPPTFTNKHKLFARAKVGNFAEYTDAEREWTNYDADGVKTFRSRLLETDSLSLGDLSDGTSSLLSYFSELERVLRVLTHTYSTTLKTETVLETTNMATSPTAHFASSDPYPQYGVSRIGSDTQAIAWQERNVETATHSVHTTRTFLVGFYEDSTGWGATTPTSWINFTAPHVGTITLYGGAAGGTPYSPYGNFYFGSPSTVTVNSKSAEGLSLVLRQVSGARLALRVEDYEETAIPLAGLCYWSIEAQRGGWHCITDIPNLSHLTFPYTATVNSITTTSFSRKHKLYQFTTQPLLSSLITTATAWYDSTGTGLGTKNYHLIDSDSDWTTDSSFAGTIFESEPTVATPPSGSPYIDMQDLYSSTDLRTYGLYGFKQLYTLGVIEWQFPNDDKLGSTKKEGG